MAKTMLITGASSGIGKEAAKVFAAHGWNVVATMRSPEKEQDLVPSDNMMLTRLDLQNAASIQEAVGETLKKFGRVDLLVNNAGYGQYGLLEEVPPEKIWQQFETNVFGVIELMRASLPTMRRQRGGMIINVGSGGGIYGVPAMSFYSASKFALEGFSEAVSYELASQNIVLKLIEPHGGVTATNFNARVAEDSGDVRAVADYDQFKADMREAYSRTAAASSISSRDVALEIYKAATDGSRRLRYFIGVDSRGFLNAKQTLRDQEYIEFMRSYFRSGEGA
jgi:NAD(P)-dependent dehydrogenase (short-subunit alcohol dehydrogenase family)